MPPSYWLLQPVLHFQLQKKWAQVLSFTECSVWSHQQCNAFADSQQDHYITIYLLKEALNSSFSLVEPSTCVSVWQGWLPSWSHPSNKQLELIGDLSNCCYIRCPEPQHSNRGKTSEHSSFHNWALWLWLSTKEGGVNLTGVVLSHLISVYGFIVHDTASHKKLQKASPFVLALPGQQGPGSRVKWPSIFTKFCHYPIAHFH